MSDELPKLCRTCRYLRTMEIRPDNTGWGECLHAPPRVILVNKVTETVRPEVNGDDYCASWKGWDGWVRG